MLIKSLCFSGSQVLQDLFLWKHAFIHLVFKNHVSIKGRYLKLFEVFQNVHTYDSLTTTFHSRRPSLKVWNFISITYTVHDKSSVYPLLGTENTYSSKTIFNSNQEKYIMCFFHIILTGFPHNLVSCSQNAYLHSSIFSISCSLSVIILTQQTLEIV